MRLILSLIAILLFTNGYPIPLPPDETEEYRIFLPIAASDFQRSRMEIGSNLWFPATWGEDATQTDYVAQLAPYKVLRMMDWSNINRNTEVEWADRGTQTSFNALGETGIAWESVIDLVNQANADLWLNIPTMASDDYIEQLAKLVSAELDTERLVYIEYSNETWNTLFPQYEYVEENGGAEFHARRSISAWNAFQEKLGIDRVVRVLALRNGDTTQLRQMVAVSGWPDVVGVNCYVGDGVAYTPDGVASDWVDGVAMEVAKLKMMRKAIPLGVELVCYEGGAHWDDGMIEFSADSNVEYYYTEMLRSFAPHVDIFLHYTHGGATWGAYGTGKYEALDKYE